MDDISRVPGEVSGVPDGVEVMTSCAVSRFNVDWSGRPLSMKERPTQHPCKMMASLTRGTVSISAHEVGVMLTVQMDEILSLIEEAFNEEG